LAGRVENLSQLASAVVDAAKACVLRCCRDLDLLDQAVAGRIEATGTADTIWAVVNRVAEVVGDLEEAMASS